VNTEKRRQKEEWYLSAGMGRGWSENVSQKGGKIEINPFQNEGRLQKKTEKWIKGKILDGRELKKESWKRKKKQKKKQTSF